MNMSNPFDIAEEMLKKYKQQPYATLEKLPDEMEVFDERLPENSQSLLLKKERHTDGKLTFVLSWYEWLNVETYQKKQDEKYQQEVIRLKDITDMSDTEKEEYLEIIRTLPSSLVRHPQNPDLGTYGGYSNYFEILPDGTLIEDEFTRSMKAEDEIVEEADWIGTTGLSEETERQLPKYLRLEYGESILDEDSLKAADLTYLGVFKLGEEDLKQSEFSQGAERVHVWEIPTSGNKTYGYVVEGEYGCISMGEYLPENKIL